MSNPALNNRDVNVVSETERDLITEAGRLVEQAQLAITLARGQIDETARLMSELLKVSAVFESLASRLIDATFKASELVTSGPPSNAMMLAFVEELGSLARLALNGSGDIRNELRTHANNTAPSVGAFREADRSLQDLTAALKHLAMLRTRLGGRNLIEIENRVAPEPPKPQTAIDRAAASGIFASRWSRSGGFKN